MKDTIPHTPFSTPLSRSAREARQRIENIVHGPQKRPPALFLALMCLIALSCGDLVSCNVAQAEPSDLSAPGSPDSSASVEVGPEEGTGPSLAGDGWLPVPLTAVITVYCPTDDPLSQEEIDRLESLPADQLPKEAVSPAPYHARREDYWHDTLLPVAYDEGTDMTVYFVVGPDSMPDMEPGASPDLYSLDRKGILLRLRDELAYHDLNWDINAKFGSAPLAAVDDFDGDGSPELALSLAWGEGTGCYCESLYIIDLDHQAMYHQTPHFSNIPLEISCDPEKTSARLVSGDKEHPVDLDWLGVPFLGEVYAGDQVQFDYKDGQLICHLALDFSGDTLGYLASAEFPIVYEDGEYRLGPATALRDVL